MIKINGQNVTNAQVVNYSLSRKEEGDRGYLVFRSSQEIQPYDLVIIEQQGTHQFVVDTAKSLQIGESDIKWEVQLKDSIHYFDKIIPPSRKFTTIGGKMASEVLDIYRKDSKGNFIFDYASNVLLDQRVTQKEYDGEPLSVILKDIGRRVNAKPILTLGEGLPYLTFVPMTKRVGTTAIDYTPEHLQTDQKSANYATQVLGKVKNAVLEDGNGSWFPSKFHGITARTEEFRFDESTAAFLFNDRIWSMIEVIVEDGVYYENESLELVYEDLTIMSLTHPDFISGDRKQRVIPKGLWDYLANPTDANDNSDPQSQVNTIYYQIGGDRVERLWSTKEGVLTTPRKHLGNAYIMAVVDFIASDTSGRTYQPNYDENDWQNMKLRFNYVSQRDLDYIIEKMDITNKYQSTLLSNQLSTLVELNQHGNAMSTLAERMANKELTYKETINTDVDTLKKLGNFTSDDRIITTVRRELNGSDTIETVELSKSFANIDVETSVSRENSAFQITGKSIITNTHTKEYIEFSEESKTIDSYLGVTARRIAVNIFDYSATYNRPIFDGEIKPTIPKFFGGDYDGKSIHTNVFPIQSNTIGWNVKFNHPTIAGYTLDGNKRGVIEYKRSINDIVQDLIDYDLQLGTESSFDDSGTVRDYPLVTSNTGLIDLGAIQVTLDPNCILAHSHNIHVVTDSPDKIILNGNFGFFNNLVKELDSANLDVYVSNGIWDVFTPEFKKIRANDTIYSAGTISYNHVTRQLTVTHPNTVDNIAIVKGDDIILALNGIDSCYINFRKNRSGLIVIGRYSISVEAQDLASLVADIDIAYSKKIYYLEITQNGLASVTADIDIEYTQKLYDLSVDQSGFVSITNDIDIAYSKKYYDLSVNESGISIVTSDIDIAYTEKDYQLSVTESNIVSITSDIDLTYTYQTWDYIGTSAPPQNETINLGTNGETTCDSSLEVKDRLETSRPAKDYATGYIMKVEHSYDDPVFGTAPCTPYYYRSVEETI